MKFLLPTIALLILASPALSEPIYIGWGEAMNHGTALNGACDPPNQVNELVGVFHMPPGLSTIYRLEATLDLCTFPDDLPPWWGGAGADLCTPPTLRAEADFADAPASYQDYWDGKATASMTYEVGVEGNPVRARAVITVEIDPADAKPVMAGTNYYGFKFVVDALAADCLGCDTATCFMLNGITLTGPEGSIRFYSGYVTAYAGWWNFNLGCPFVVPVENTNFGALKATYRN